MKEFFKRLDNETLWGGIFSVVAIIAIFVEMTLGGFTAQSIASAVKDIAGTVVSVMVFYIAAKHILKQIKESKTFEDKITNSLKAWHEAHSNMIVRKEKHDHEEENGPASCLSFDLKTNISDFYSNNDSAKTGLFLRMPLLKKENYNNGNIILKFRLNKGTFFEGLKMTNEELSNGYEKLNILFKDFINTSFPDFAVASGKGQDITVTIKSPIESQADIDKLISVIDSMYNAYLVAANLNIQSKKE